MENKLDLNQIANIVMNEAELLHCTREEAWRGINPNLTKQFTFDEVESLIEKLVEQSKWE